jgi:ABC-2 type transport system permease protein
MSTTTLTPQDAARRERPAGEAGVSLPRVIRMEWIKFWSLRSTIYTPAVTAVIVVGIGMLTTSLVGAGDGPPQSEFPDPTSISLGGVPLGGAGIAVLGVLTITGEYAT